MTSFRKSLDEGLLPEALADRWASFNKTTIEIMRHSEFLNSFWSKVFPVCALVITVTAFWGMFPGEKLLAEYRISVLIFNIVAIFLGVISFTMLTLNPNLCQMFFEDMRELRCLIGDYPIDLFTKPREIRIELEKRISETTREVVNYEESLHERSTVTTKLDEQYHTGYLIKKNELRRLRAFAQIFGE